MPETGVARTAEGPWTRAANVGLFPSENVSPETASPKFRLTRVNEALEGSFELQELIDFAVRKILPRDAAIQPVDRSDWIPVSQFPILDACLRGELSRNPAPATPPPVSPSIPPHDHAQPPVTASVHHADLMTTPDEDLDLILSDHRAQVQKDVQEKIANRSHRPRFKFKVAHAGWSAMLLLLMGLLVWWIMQPPPSRTDRSEVIGDWVLIPNQEQGRAFGISFKEDGACVVFNSDGDCWSGDFQWFDDATNEVRVESRGLAKSKDADIASHHHRFTAQASDGYVRLEGGSFRRPPMLGKQPIRECFLRQDGEYLWIGYLINMDSDDEENSLDVRWVSLWPSNRVAGFGTLDIGMRGANLLARYGVPDEARPLSSLEVTANSDPELAEPRSFIRYGTTRLTLLADGSVRRFKDPETANASSRTNPSDK